MQVLGARASASFGSEPDIKEWAQECLLNPTRVAPEQQERPEVLAAQDGLAEHAVPGFARLRSLPAMNRSR